MKFSKNFFSVFEVKIKRGGRLYRLVDFHFTYYKKSPPIKMGISSQFLFVFLTYIVYHNKSYQNYKPDKKINSVVFHCNYFLLSSLFPKTYPIEKIPTTITVIKNTVSPILHKITIHSKTFN
jgi:hypothetical protein